MPVFCITLLQKRLQNDVLARTYLWPQDVRRRVVRETLRDIVTAMFSREDVDTDTVDSISPADIWLATRWADEAKRTNRDICEVAREFDEKVPDLKWDVGIVFGYTEKRQREALEPSSPDPKRVKTVTATDEFIVDLEQPGANTLIDFLMTRTAPTDNIVTEDPIAISTTTNMIPTTVSGDTTTKESDSQILQKARSFAPSPSPSPAPSSCTLPSASPIKHDL